MLSLKAPENILPLAACRAVTVRERCQKAGFRRIPLFFGTCALLCAADASFNATRYLDHIKYLASPELKGRATGSPELEKAAKYIADQFRADGLQPPPGSAGGR